MRRALLTMREPVFSSLELLDREFARHFANEFERETGRAYEQDLAQIMETDEAFLTTVDIPGVTATDINVDIEENRLIISAERKNPFDKTGTVSKKYNHTINLPKNVDQDKISAHYENGVLSLSIPKLNDQKAKKKIEISTGQKPKSWTNFLGFGKNETENVAS